MATAAVAQPSPPSQALALQEYLLSAADAQGDIHSDVSLLQVFERSLSPAAPVPVEPSLAARMAKRVDLLRARVDAAAEHDPMVLGRLLDCPAAPPATPICQQQRRRLAELAGDNAFHHVQLAALAWRLDDADAFVDHLHLGAAAPRYESDFGLMFGSLRQRLAQVPAEKAAALSMSPESLDRNMAMAMNLATVWPRTSDFTTPCRESAGQVRDDCLAIAKRMMAQADTALEQLVASSLVQALGTPTEQARAVVRKRELAWLLTKSGELLTRADEEFVPGMADYFDTYAHAGEVEALAGLLAANGEPLQPPESWQPTGLLRHTLDRANPLPPAVAPTTSRND